MSYHFIPVRMTIIKKRQKLVSVGEDVEKSRSLHIAGWNLNEFSQYGEQLLRSLETFKEELLCDPVISPPDSKGTEIRMLET
jgi:hypothetical protein